MAAFSLAMPCPVRVFANADLMDARHWLAESLGSMHLERHDDVIQGLDGVRLLLDLRQFDGWAGLGGLWRHLALVRDHHRAVRRVAVVGNSAWQALAEKLVSRFVNAETRFFDGADHALAETWIRQ